MGPLLFRIYINDIYKSSNKFFLFADVTTLLFAHKNLQLLEKSINTELREVSEWLIVDKLTLNIKNQITLYFTATRRRLIRRLISKCTILVLIGPVLLIVKNLLKVLGILINSNLNWKHHINFVSLKIS